MARTILERFMDFEKAEKEEGTPEAERLKPSGIEVGHDPVYEELKEKYERAVLENEQLKAAVSSAERDFQEVVADEKGKIEEAQRRYTKEELHSMRHAANIDMEEQVQHFIRALRQRADVVLSGKKLRWTPPITDTIVIGQFAIPFIAGVERGYTREAIEIYKNRQRQLAEYRRMKGEFGATPAGQAVEPIEAAKYQKLLDAHT